ncbi:MAG: BlaI/MecI/CopY family transcriptional regulator [Phycisphaerae bacterium]|nr:BlaI/MecI/CopY family transcriptional regulator [Phycisphaerae bacterium]
MKRMPRISESEWLVMRVLWSKGAVTANEVVEQLAGETQWKPKTVKTLINRLVKKGAIRFDREGRQYRYHPATGEAECVRKERLSFVQRVYGGTTKPMLAAFLEDAQLSPEDIAELKTILEEKGRE